MNFDEIVKAFFKSFTELYTAYDWWAVGIVVLTSAIMVAVNFGLKKAFSKVSQKNQVFDRVRKTCSTLSVFVVAIGVLYLYQATFGEQIYDFPVILSQVWAVGTSAMALWFIVKVIYQVGFAKVAQKILANNEAKDLLYNMGLDKNLAKSAMSAIDSVLSYKLKDGETNIDEYVKANESELVGDITAILSQYNVPKQDLNDYALAFVEVIKIKNNLVEESNNG